MQTFDQAENTTKSKHEHSTIKLKITKHQNKKNNNKKKLTLLLVKTTQAVSIENNSWELHLWTSSSQTTKAQKQTLSLSIFYNKSCFQTPKEFKILKTQASQSSKSSEHSSDLTARNQREARILTPASAKRITSEEPNPETERESQAKFALLQCKATWGWIGTKEEEEIYRVIAKSLWTSKKDREKCFV